MNNPALIEFPVFDAGVGGSLSFAEAEGIIPFSIKRVYWIYGAAKNTIRGDHAHKAGMQVLLALGGKVEVELTDRQGKSSCYRLEKPDTGLFVPCHYWRKVIMDENSILVSFASELYDSQNYITDYETFINAL